MKKLLLLLLLVIPVNSFASFDEEVYQLQTQWNDAFTGTDAVIEAISIIPPLVNNQPTTEFNIIEFLWFDGSRCYVTQDEHSHILPKNWSMYALDIGCVGEDYNVVVPDYITGWYTISKIGIDKYLGNYITLDFWDWYTLVYWHTISNHKIWDKLYKWELIGTYKKSGVTSGRHSHIELWKNGTNITFDLLSGNKNSLKLRLQRGRAKPEESILRITEDTDYLGEFTLSRYYSPVPNQERYYMWVDREREIRMQCGCPGGNCNEEGCKYPADWKLLTDADIGKSYACPPELPLWTKIKLVFHWWEVEWVCRDRGGAIKNARLDAFCWFGMTWLTNIEQWKWCFTWKAKVFIIK